jgi:hypothetical protein
MNTALRSTTSVAAGKRLGTTIKYLQRTTSGATGNGPGTTIKYLRHRTSGAVGNGPGTTIAPRSSSAAAGISRSQRSSTFDAQRAALRATAWAPR